MKLLLAAPAALLAFASLPVDTLSFGVEEGTTVSKRIETTFDFALDDMTMVMNGEEQEMPMEDQGARVGLEIGVVDTYEAVADGKPTKVLRSYETLGAWFESDDGDSDEQEIDDLVGKSVRFSWDEEAGEYTKAWHGDEGEDAMLGALVEDMDYKSFLPESEVAVGDSWKLGGKHFTALLLPGLSMEGLLSEDGPLEIDQPIDIDLEELFKEAEGLCTYKGTESGDDGELATIELKWSLDTTLDIDPVDFGMESEFQEFGAFEITPSIMIEGTMTWDVAAGRFRSLTLEGDGNVSVHIEISMSFEEFEMEMENDIELSVSLVSEATAE